MIDKKTITEKVARLQQLAARYDLQDTVGADCEQLLAAIDGYAFRILLIGGFSAGKSAFLNALLQRDILQEGQAPETTLATELVYDTDEYVEAVDQSGRSTRFEPDAAKDLSPADCRNLVYHINSDVLLKNPDVILVDMPGIDSDVEYHDKAIAQYIARGSAYFLLISTEDGTVRRSVSDFLSETAQYPQSVACFISKTDLRMPEENAQVIQEVSRAIEAVYGAPIPVTPVSRFDEDFSEKVLGQIQRFAPQALFEQRYAPELNALISVTAAALTAASSALSLDTDALDKEIQECVDAQDEIRRRAAREAKRNSLRFDQQVIPGILSDIKSALLSRLDSLFDALTVSSEAFNGQVNSIVRPVLYRASEQLADESFDEFIAGMDAPLLEGADSTQVTAVISDTLHTISSSIDHLRIAAGKRADETGKQAYQAITSVLAIATDFIAPAIEIILVFLPSILDLFAEAARNAKLREMKERLRTVIIPEIVEKLRPQVTASAYQIRDEMQRQLEARMLVSLEARQKALDQVLQERESAKGTYDAKKEQFARDLAALNDIRL